MAVPDRDKVRDLLTTRRTKARPEQVELPTGGNRRVSGLRRTEVALLAGASGKHYAQLERGNLAGASQAVPDAVARALRLDDAEPMGWANSPSRGKGHSAHSQWIKSPLWTVSPSALRYRSVPFLVVRCRLGHRPSVGSCHSMPARTGTVDHTSITHSRRHPQVDWLAATSFSRDNDLAERDRHTVVPQSTAPRPRNGRGARLGTWRRG